MTTAQETLSKHGIKLERYAPGRHYTTCPKCSHARSTPHRKNKVLGITVGEDGSVCWGCNHCAWIGPEKGRGERQKLQTYVYRDAEGVPLFRKIRNAPGRTPDSGWNERTGAVDGSRDLRRTSTVRFSTASTK